MKKVTKIVFGLLFFSLLIVPNITQAQILPPCTATGNCGVCDFIQTFVNIIRWVLGVLGGAALLLIVWHGFSWIVAGGNKEKIEAGRKGLMHTTIGLFIILGSWLLVNITLIILLTPAGQTTDVKKLFSTSNTVWYEFCQGSGTEFCKQGWGEGTPCGNGRFCLRRGGAITCDYTNANEVEFENACQYWVCHPTRKEYENYNCVTKESDCVPGKILGAEYCVESGEVCCEPKDKSKYICPAGLQPTAATCTPTSAQYNSQSKCDSECPGLCQNAGCPTNWCSEIMAGYIYKCYCDY